MSKLIRFIAQPAFHTTSKTRSGAVASEPSAACQALLSWMELRETGGRGG
jgi:hypothetical protein